jgi:hypothetical protein
MKTLTFEEVTPISKSKYSCLNVYVWNIAWTFVNEIIVWDTIEKVNKKLLNSNTTSRLLLIVLFIKSNFSLQ